MRLKKALKSLIILVLCISICTFEVFALHPDVLTDEGFKQVTNKGGTQYTNTKGENDGVFVSKTIEETGLENYFDITLTVNSYSKVSEILKDQDLAIVIVMDISNTMNKNDVTQGGKNISRLKAAQESAKTFITKFEDYSDDVNAIRKLGFVAFNTDAHKIFDFQDCNTNAKRDNLISEMITDTNNIATADGYATSPSRFTNIEGGLKMANNMLDKQDVKNKYIIFISDGFPTTYVKNGNKGYNPYMINKYNSDFDDKGTYTSSGDGIFYNEFSNKLCIDGTDYSDEGARRATAMAAKIKAKGTKIFSIGISISDSRVIDKNSYLTDVSKEEYNAKNNFEIGSNGAEFKNWLQHTIGSGYYYDSTSLEQLNAAFDDIFVKVKASSSESSQATWVAKDPMGSIGDNHIQFIGLYDDLNTLQGNALINDTTINQSDTATYSESDNTISWDLKNSMYSETTDDNGVTYYLYQIKYRVRLKNELTDFDINNVYNTNGTTTLTYAIRQEIDGVLGSLSEDKKIEFPIPKVVGYLGSLTFTKQSNFGGSPLEGAKFKLVHSEHCNCLTENKHMDSNQAYYATSDANGMVTFNNIPSGHKYVLIETVAPDNHLLSQKTYDIEVAYGNTTGGPENMIVVNDIKTTNLEIFKQLDGNKLADKEFTFKVEIKYKDKKLIGNYYYKKTGNGKEEEGTIDIAEGIIKLKDNEKITIYNLPATATYTLTETNTDGYEVSYILNSSEEKEGTTAICDLSNSCHLKAEGNNTIKFINLASYILPETGSSGMLILSIIGALLFGTPIIYIGYSFYQNERSVNQLLKR